MSEGETVEKCPIIVDVSDPEWLNEVRMVATVTGRWMIMADSEESMAAVERVLESSAEMGQSGSCVAMMIADRPNHLSTHNRVRPIKLDELPRSYEHGGALDLARIVGMQDLPIIAVHGAVGGAGTTVLTAGIARALAERNLPVFILDADPTSLGCDIALGVESALPAGAVETVEGVSFEAISHYAPRVANIPVLPARAYPHEGAIPRAESALLDAVSTALVDASVVVDCGTARPGSPEYGRIFDRVCPDFHVVVTTNTVAGLMYAQLACEKIERHHGVRPMVVIRTRHESELPQAMAQVLLQGTPVTRLFSEARLARELDKGNPDYFLHGGHNVVRVALELLGRWEAENFLIFDELISAGQDAEKVRS